MSCLFKFLKVFAIIIVIMVVFSLAFISLFIDVFRIAEGKDPIFFVESIESYEGNMFDDMESKLIANFNSNKSAFEDLEEHLSGFSPEHNLEIEMNEYDENSIDISASYKGGSSYYGNYDYRDEENQEFLRKVKLTPHSIDQLKRKLKAADCISINLKRGTRVGYRDENHGTYYYRFIEGESVESQAALNDSCLVKYFKSHVFLEYTGSGRGTDCIVNKNPEDFDDRTFFEKWRDIYKSGGKIEKDK